ncbi:MAG TPA: LysR family transcriptional regulator [Hyphomicrobium sp.]|nr:LysR family transcriptional regulator [Hyphomicrobium sp.]
MNLKALRAFQLIVEGGSLTAASKSLGLSQPAVSRLVALLEDELKLTLFSRSGRALRVTDKGAAFYVATRHILQGLGEIPRIAKDIQTSDKHLKVITTPRIAQGLMSPSIERLLRLNPKLRCTVDVLSRFDIDNLAGLRRFDLAIASLPVTHALVELDNHPLFKVRLEAVMRKDHPLAVHERITAADLADENLLGLWEDQLWRQQMNDFMRSSGKTAQYAVETRSSLMAFQLAVDGAGIAVFDRVSARGFDMRDVVLRPLDPERWISFGYVHHRDQKPAQNAQLLIDCVLHTIEAFRDANAANAASIEVLATHEA